MSKESDFVDLLNKEMYELKIADLEAKLAESESKRKGLEEKVKFLTEEKEENFVDGQKYNELNQQLKKKPKYNIGDRVYIINKDYEVERDFIESIDIDTFGIEYYTVMHSICWYENELFTTKAEAEAKLKELTAKNV